MKKKRNKIEIGYEYYPWWAVASILGLAWIFAIIQQLANLLISGL